MEGSFVEEVNYNEIQISEPVGRGAFGVVLHGRWRGEEVAVKLIETESEKKAFLTELKQLSRVSHPNIIRLYGACINPPVCLVMEFAEGGSLYNLLHNTGEETKYSAGHAISWCLQCAYGVEYLHDMKPKPLVHRDLKPPNLLLFRRGTVIKICDFGTACDAQTQMTNNKGSAAWMAPEVFEGSNYSEKCDVFSWGIILWEVLTRKKPFDDIGGPAFRIMWAVHNGTRPPPIKNCPLPIEKLMKRCWSANLDERPSMSEVVKVMQKLSRIFKGADEPIYIKSNETAAEGFLSDRSRSSSVGFTHLNETLRDRTPDTVFTPRFPVPFTRSSISAELDLRLGISRPLFDASESSNHCDPSSNKRYSVDYTSTINSHENGRPAWVREHRRAGSYGTPILSFTGTCNGFTRGHRRTNSQGSNNLNSVENTHPFPSNIPPSEPPFLNFMSPPLPNHSSNILPNFDSNLSLNGDDSAANATTNLLHVTLNRQLQPVQPCTTSPESMEIYNRHLALAEHYIGLQAEIQLQQQKKSELLGWLQKREEEKRVSRGLKMEYEGLLTENESLRQLHENLKRQVEIIKRNAEVV